MNTSQKKTPLNPYVMKPVRLACVNVLGRIWSGAIATYTYQLSDSDLNQIEEFTRENVEKWLRTGASDFQSITDFEAFCGEEYIDWATEDAFDQYESMQ